jgi:hypothetical protein
MRRILTRLTARSFVFTLLVMMLAVLSGCDGGGYCAGGATDSGAHGHFKMGVPL